MSDGRGSEGRGSDPTNEELPSTGPRARFVSTVVEVEGRSEVKVVELPDTEPTPWGDDAALSIVGQPVPRVDARQKVTGRAKFPTDIQRPGMLHAAFVRAPIAHGTVSAIDATAAMQLAGVVDVLTASTLPRPIRAGGIPLLGTAILYPHQPVAAVCAESREAALAGAAAVRVSYDVAPFAITFEDATAPDAPLVRGTTNVMRGSPRIVERGDVDTALAKAEVVVTREYRTGSALHSPMEPHATVAEWDGDRLTLWESTQGIYRVRDEVANGLGLARSHVRVIKEYMGGGFGGKNNAGAQTFVAALFAQRTGRAVRCVLEREDEQSDGGHRAPSRQVVTLGAMRDGRLVAIDVRTEIPLGASGWEGSVAAIYGEMYSCRNVRTHETFAWAHTQPMMAFRAPGHVEGAFGLERTMDVLARVLGADPLALRLTNFAERDEGKDRAYSSNRLRACYEEGARRFGWGGRTRAEDGGGGGMMKGGGGRGAGFDMGGDPGAPASMRAAHAPESHASESHAHESNAPESHASESHAHESNAPESHAPESHALESPPNTSASAPGYVPGRNVRRGVGMAACVWGAGGGPPAYATVRLNSDATVDVLSGTQDLGTGSRTVLAQIAAESLGARLADVRVVLGDTERTPYAGNSWGSMTTASVGPAVRLAGEQARHRLLEAAGQLLECHVDDLVAHDSTIVTRDGARRLTFAEVTRKLGNVMIMGQGSRGPNPQDVALMSFGAQFAEVEVDLDTGVVRVLRLTAAHDVGRVINPLLAGSQMEGAILQGLGYALFEERLLDGATGRPVNPSLHEYKIPTMADVPLIDAFCVEGSDPVANHVGARGLAEPPIIPTAPAIANAVADALGVEVHELPLTPWRVREAMEQR